MFRLSSLLLTAIVSIFLSGSNCAADHQVLLHGGNRLAIVDPGGAISWEMPWRGIHDIHLLDNGNILTADGKAAVVEIDRESKKVVWKYDSDSSNGNEGKRIEVHAFERLSNGNTMIAESGRGRIIEVDRDGKLVKVIGNCHAGPGQPLLVEINPKTKEVVWTFDRHADFGNNVSNSLLVDMAGKSLR